MRKQYHPSAKDENKPGENNKAANECVDVAHNVPTLNENDKENNTELTEC